MSLLQNKQAIPYPAMTSPNQQSPQDSDAKATTYPLVEALLKQRKLKKITQAELAQAAHLSRMTIQRLESNGLDPRLSTLQEMAKVLGHQIVLVPAHLHDPFQSWLEQQSAQSNVE